MIKTSAKAFCFFVSLVWLFSGHNSFAYRILDEDDQVFVKKDENVNAKQSSSLGGASADEKNNPKRKKYNDVGEKDYVDNVEVGRVNSMDVGLGLYGGVGMNANFMGSVVNLSAMLRLGVDFHVNMFYFAAEVFGTLGAQAGHIDRAEFVVGGNVKFGATVSFGGWANYLIISAQYEDSRAFARNYFSLGFGCGFKIRVFPHIHIFLEQKIMFRTLDYGNGTGEERPLVGPSLAIGLDFYI